MEVLRIVVSLLRFGPFLCLLALLTLCAAVNFQDPQRNICNWGSPWTQVVAIHRSHTRKCFMIWYFHIFPDKQWLDPILSFKAPFLAPIQMGLEGYPQFKRSPRSEPGKLYWLPAARARMAWGGDATDSSLQKVVVGNGKSPFLLGKDAELQWNCKWWFCLYVQLIYITIYIYIYDYLCV